MRIFVVLFSFIFVSFPCWNAQADDGKSKLFDQCVMNKKDESFCTCAMGNTYDELDAKQRNIKSDALQRRLKTLEERYQKAYQVEIERGGLNPQQIEQLCDVVDEYYAYKDELGIEYKQTSKKSALVGRKSMTKLSTNEQRQAYTIKMTELRKKMQDLNNEFQRGGAVGGFMGFENGTCRLELEIQWMKEEIAVVKSKEASAPTAVGLRQLISKGEENCGG